MKVLQHQQHNPLSILHQPHRCVEPTHQTGHLMDPLLGNHHHHQHQHQYHTAGRLSPPPPSERHHTCARPPRQIETIIHDASKLSVLTTHPSTDLKPKLVLHRTYISAAATQGTKENFINFVTFDLDSLEKLHQMWWISRNFRKCFCSQQQQLISVCWGLYEFVTKQSGVASPMIGLSVNVRDPEISENNRHFGQLHKFLPCHRRSLFRELKGQYNTIKLTPLSLALQKLLSQLCPPEIIIVHCKELFNIAMVCYYL